ncbi:DNA topoisomerase [Salix suchowensis]|nr:DNA topoisomerase [Salix suchowensis]
MDAESGPARAATLLAGTDNSISVTLPTNWKSQVLDSTRMLKSNRRGRLVVVGGKMIYFAFVIADVLQRCRGHRYCASALGRLDYYKGNFTQFYATKSERDKNLRKEYDAQVEYRKHLQAFIDRWRYNANRVARPAASRRGRDGEFQVSGFLRIWPLRFTRCRFPETEKLSPPVLQLNEVTFSYKPERVLLKNVNFDIQLDSRIAIVGANGAGKSTLWVHHQVANGGTDPEGRARKPKRSSENVRVQLQSLSDTSFNALQRLLCSAPRGYVDSYDVACGIPRVQIPRLQPIGTLSGGQKSRVAFALLSLQRPHVLLLDEPTNHLDIEGLDALMLALQTWNGGVIIISHDERFITTVAKEVGTTFEICLLWVCGDEQCISSWVMCRVTRCALSSTGPQFTELNGCVQSLIVSNVKAKA